MQKKRVLKILIPSIVALAVLSTYYLTRNQSSELALYGRIDQRSVQVAFEVSGKIERINVKEGTRVQKGQPLADLECSAYQIAYDRAWAQQGAAQAPV